MKVVTSAELPAYLPDGHWGMQARQLGDGRQLEMTMCTMEPGGGAHPHVHADRPQMLLVMGGELTIWAGGAEPETVHAGQAAWFEPGESHEVHNDGIKPARYFAVSVLPA